jgi:cation transport ATPase
MASANGTTTFKAVPGHGIEATIDHHHILVGNRKLMADNDISLPISCNCFIASLA